MNDHPQALLDLAKGIIADFPDSFTTEHTLPQRIACLFLLNSLIGDQLEEFQPRLYDLLLDSTIHNAINSCPWYKKTLETVVKQKKRPFNTEYLFELPVFDRDDLDKNTSEFRSRHLDFGFASFTSGSSNFKPLIIDISLEEQMFINEFYRIINPPSKVRSKPIALNLANNFHGHLIDVPSSFHRIDVSVNSMSGLTTALNLLKRKFKTNDGEVPISVVGGTLISLLRLTAFLEHEYKREDLPPIQFVQSTSEYMSPNSLRILENFWGCTVEDRYGLSEIFLGAWRCQACGMFHFEPYGIPEVVGMTDHLPVSEGIGRLVLTSFYPFMQMIPMIRYMTGDIVEITNNKCPTNQPAYRLLGRQKNSLLHQNKILIGEYEMTDILDEEPEVYHRRRYKELPSYLHDVGAPPEFKFSFDENQEPGVEVFLKYDPAKFPDMATALEARIKKALADKGLPLPKISFKAGFEPEISMF